MSNSPLVTYTKISPNRTSPRNHKIDTISIHCAVMNGTAKRILNLSHFTKYDNDNGVSCNYAVGSDGSIGMGVEEKDRSWCTSSRSNDHRAITIEVATTTTHPYVVTDAAYNALIDLLVDICQRNGIKELKWKGDKSLIGQVDKQNMTVHRWFANKECPGDWLYDRHGQIAAEVNKRLGVAKKTETKKPASTKPSTTQTTSSEKVSDTKMPTIKSGSKSKAVRLWQVILGFTGDDVDGKFGKITKQKTIAFQKKAFPKDKTQWDGIVGPKTWKAGLESVK